MGADRHNSILMEMKDLLSKEHYCYQIHALQNPHIDTICKDSIYKVEFFLQGLAELVIQMLFRGILIGSIGFTKHFLVFNVSLIFSSPPLK